MDNIGGFHFLHTFQHSLVIDIVFLHGSSMSSMVYWHFFIHITSLRKYWSFIKCGFSIQYAFFSSLVWFFSANIFFLFIFFLDFSFCLYAVFFIFAFCSVYTWCHIGSETVFPRNISETLYIYISFLNRGVKDIQGMEEIVSFSVAGETG